MRAVLFAVGALCALACRSTSEGAGVAQGTVSAADGVSIAYDTRGKGDTALVFVHCWACDRSFWREQLDAFAADYRVVALDLGGHGESGTNRAVWSVLQLGGDVQAVVEALDLDHVILVGHSLGGPVALEAARRMPGRVLGVVCVETMHDAEVRIDPEQNEQAVSGLEGSFPESMAGFVRAAFADGADSAVVEWVIEKAVATNQPAAIGLARDVANLDFSVLLSAAGVPVRAINAAARPPAVPQTEIEVNRRYADFDARIMEDVGHFLMLERPEEFNAMLREVLAGFDPR
jgi:pimeloyl-ACP methyl ester carboxylesterase